MKKGRSSFRGKVGRDAERQKSAGSSYGYLKLPKGLSVFKEEAGGRHYFDIIPYEVSKVYHPDRVDDTAAPGTLWYKRPFKIHRNIGTAKDAVVCPTSFGKKCPICEHRALRVKEGADKKELDALKPSWRNLYLIIPLKDKKFEKKIHVWDISQAMFQDLLADEVNEKPENEIFPDIEEGKTLYVRFDSKTIGSGRPFAEASRIDFEPRERLYKESILDEVPCLDDLLNLKTYKELEALFFELDAEDITDEGVGEYEDEAPAKPSRRKPAPVEEEEPEDDDDAEPAPPPRRKRQEEPVGRRKPAPVEDDGDEDEDEPEEEPAPRRRSTKPEPAKPARRKPAPVEDDGDEDEDEEEPAPPISRKKQPAAAPAKAGKSSGKGHVCPYGHKFGKDCERFDDCDECELWDACVEASEK